MARAITKTIGLTVKEDIKDYFRAGNFEITLPASSILIGTGGNTGDAELYTAGALTFSFLNGTGDNGLDTGTEAASSWYALYAVPSAAAGIYTLKATLRHPQSQPGPLGYTKWRYLGLFRNGDPLATGDIVEFDKVGPTIMFRRFTNSVAQGIVQATGGPGTSVSTSTSFAAGMVGAGSIPFEGILYKWNMSTVNVANGTTPGIISAVFLSSGFNMYGVVTTPCGGSNSPSRPCALGQSEFMWDSGCTQALISTNLAPTNGTFNWRLMLAGFTDPLLVSQVRGA